MSCFKEKSPEKAKQDYGVLLHPGDKLLAMLCALSSCQFMFELGVRREMLAIKSFIN